MSAHNAPDALKDAVLSVAPVQPLGPDPSWREGNVQDSADSVRNADLSGQRIGFAIERSVREAAEELYQAGFAPQLATALELPKTSKDLRASTLVATLIISNATLLHHRLR